MGSRLLILQWRGALNVSNALVDYVITFPHNAFKVIPFCTGNLGYAIFKDAEMGPSRVRIIVSSSSSPWVCIFAMGY